MLTFEAYLKIWFCFVGLLVVNVSWRGRTYVGTLLDATKHDLAPPRYVTHTHTHTHTHTRHCFHIQTEHGMAFRIKTLLPTFFSLDLRQNLAICREIPVMLGIADFVFSDKTTQVLSCSDIQALSVVERNSLGLRINSPKWKRLFTLCSQTLWFVGFFRKDVSTVW